MVFVTFNRVCTSQYFVWSLWFLPLILPNLHPSRKGGIAALGLWIVGQAIWLSYGYRLEFLGDPVYLELFGASVAFFLVNVGVICWLLAIASNGRDKAV
jgi:phosphatidylinositol glycan class M